MLSNLSKIRSCKLLVLNLVPDGIDPYGEATVKISNNKNTECKVLKIQILDSEYRNSYKNKNNVKYLIKLNLRKVLIANAKRRYHCSKI